MLLQHTLALEELYKKRDERERTQVTKDLGEMEFFTYQALAHRVLYLAISRIKVTFY